MNEYKISKGWAIFIYISAPLGIALFCWILIMPFVPGMKGDIAPELYWFFIPMCVGMITLMIIALIDTASGKFVIDKEQIFLISTFSKRQLTFDEIKGYRVKDQYIVIESTNGNNKKIKVSKYFEKTDEIIEWLAQNYFDLDRI